MSNPRARAGAGWIGRVSGRRRPNRSRSCEFRLRAGNRPVPTVLEPPFASVRSRLRSRRRQRGGATGRGATGAGPGVFTTRKLLSYGFAQQAPGGPPYPRRVATDGPRGPNPRGRKTMDERPNEYRPLRDAPAARQGRSEPFETAEIPAPRFPKPSGREKAANGGESEPSGAVRSPAGHDRKPSGRDADRIGFVPKPSARAVLRSGASGSLRKTRDLWLAASRRLRHQGSERQDASRLLRQAVDAAMPCHGCSPRGAAAAATCPGCSERGGAARGPRHGWSETGRSDRTSSFVHARRMTERAG